MIMNILYSRLPALKICLSVAWLLLAAACAKIAEPLPPLVQIPKPAADLKASQLADSVVLTFSEPEFNTDGSPATTFERVQVLRLDDSANKGDRTRPVSEKLFRERADIILTLESRDFSAYLQNGHFMVRDTGAASKTAGPLPPSYRYAVFFINRKNQAAGLSNQVRIMPVSLPDHPSGFSAKVTEDAIRLEWEEPTENTDGTKPARIAGYNIYRSAQKGKMPEAPINPGPVKSPAYEDRNFQFDKTYYYAVSTVGSLKDPYAESLQSEIHAVAARDIFPPAPPENFNAALEGDDIILLWAPSPSDDVAGYRLFRRDTGTSVRQPLQNALITALSFRDENVQPGKNYEYTLYAVDKHGNESAAVQAKLESQQQF